jgi:putative ATP-dependent endonuclease of OLD family
VREVTSMRIIKFGVTNYRCISGGLEQNTIKFDGSNTIFIIGQNNAGKSSILNAYKLFYNDETPKNTDFYRIDSSSIIIIEIEVEFNLDEKEGFGAKKDQAEKYFYGSGKNH